MWKRWSLKSSSTSAPDVGRVKSQAPPTDNTEDLTSRPSVMPETVLEDKVDSTTNAVREASLSATQQPTEQTGQDPVAQSTSTSQSPATHGSSGSTVTEDPGPSPDVPDALVPNGSTTPRAAPLLAAAPENEAAQNHEAVSSSDVVSPDEEKPRENALDLGGCAGGNTLETPTPANTLSTPESQHPPRRVRRISFRSIAFFYGRDIQPQTPPTSPSPPTTTPKGKPQFPPKIKLSRSEKQALSSAVALRTLIIGTGSFSADCPDTTKVKVKFASTPRSPDLNKLKDQLLKPKSANAVIAQLRRLPLPDGPSFRIAHDPSSQLLVTHPDAGGAPIHAVCLAYTDEEADEKHFSRLRPGNIKPGMELATTPISGLPSIGTASLETLTSVLHDLRPISLLTSPDLGFGQPVGENEGAGGILSGSVPSAGTVVDGFEEITKQLMMLGFATSKSVFPSHAGIYPPEDRMSVLTYWWGLELVLPEPSVKYLSKAKSISNALLNFLSAVALFNNGVREVLPFIRYIANFVDFEWSAVTGQDKGKGVVCAATWIMPAAMVPRPWDFPSRPPSKSTTAAPTTTLATAPTTPPALTTHARGHKAGNAGNDKTPADVPPELSPTAPSNVPYPPVPAIPMLPQLMVTPATLPRSVAAPQPEEAP